MTDEVMGLGRFFAQAARLPLLTASQEVDLAQRRDRGDPTAKRALVEHNIRLGIKLAKNYRNQGLDFEDLVQEATIGLDRAATKFDWRKGFKFSTYATWWVTKMLQSAVQNQGATIRTPGHIISRRNKCRRYLHDHPDADLDELATLCDCTTDEVEQALDVTRVIASLDTMFEDDTAYDMFADPDAVQPDEVLMQDDRLREAMRELTTQQRRVLELRFGFNGPVHSRNDTAEILGVQPPVVTREQQTALAELHRILGEDYRPPTGPRLGTTSGAGGTGPDCARTEPKC